MFRKLSILILPIIISSNAFAYLFEDMIYLRADFMGSKYNSVIFSDQNTKYRHRSQENIAFDIGAGMQFFDGLRGEVVLIHHLPTTFTNHTKTKKEIKVKNTAILARAAYDIIDLELVKLFIGGGLGYAKTDHKFYSASAVTMQNGAISYMRSKTRHNFAWNALVGIGAEIWPNTTLEAGYLYGDYGKTKSFKEAPGYGAIALRSHNIFLGIRYEF
jgi:opacity protein-like surface antigen